MKQEIAAMRARCPDVLVATPNKLLFLLGCERVKLQPLFDDVRLLVIDSADVQAAPEFRYAMHLLVLGPGPDMLLSASNRSVRLHKGLSHKTGSCGQSRYLVLCLPVCMCRIQQVS